MKMKKLSLLAVMLGMSALCTLPASAQTVTTKDISEQLQSSLEEPLMQFKLLQAAFQTVLTNPEH